VSPQWLRGAAYLSDDHLLVYENRALAETYAPLVHQRIGLALAGVKTPEDVLLFVSRFGLLLNGATTWEHESQSAEIYEPVLDYVRAADELRLIIATLNNVRRGFEGDEEALVRLRQNFSGNRTHALLVAASKWAADRLQRKLGEARPFVYDRAAMGETVPPGRFRIGILPETLLAACYMQIAVALAEKEPIEVCPECTRAFIVEDGRQRFCTPACASRARFRRFLPKRKRGKVAKSVKTRKK
jgi:hypothetical protein